MCWVAWLFVVGSTTAAGSLRRWCSCRVVAAAAMTAAAVAARSGKRLL
jgi:hypothetical protein